MENMHIDVRVYKVKITKQESIFTFSRAILFFLFFFFFFSVAKFGISYIL